MIAAAAAAGIALVQAPAVPIEAQIVAHQTVDQHCLLCSDLAVLWFAAAAAAAAVAAAALCLLDDAALTPTAGVARASAEAVAAKALAGSAGAAAAV